jgi:very-short-patch-repair endonuclease/DNA polymerase III delta prime subunit
MNTIIKELESARNNLLDLTMRNQLLNFRPSKNRTIRVVDEVSQEVYDRLVIQEKNMEFQPKPKNQRDEIFIDENQQEVTNQEIENDEASVLWKMPESDEDLENKHVDRFLQTTLKGEVLQKKMYYISQQSQSVLEEQGYTVLYLALGFLEWEDPNDNSKLRKSPLILVPVELSRTKLGGPFKLSWTGEDIFTNISLQAKLTEEEISLPEFQMPEDKSGIDQYYKDVSEAIAKKPNWKVLSDINLSFFSFTKFVMYKDLDPLAWPKDKSPTNHPLIQSMFDSKGQNCETDFSEDDVDKKLDDKSIYHVMDADPSQISVIEDVKSGKNMVVEGPPGTGKSQTITNIISELLASDKSVLFVSEKMAALEVVKGRLDQVGLGDFCLELHSRKSNKKEVLKELERTVSLSPPKSVSLDAQFEKLGSLKKELNDYASALRKPFAGVQQSPFNLFCMKEEALSYFEKNNKEIPYFDFSDVEQCSQKDWTESLSALSNISDVLPLVKPINENPWNGCSPGMVLPSDESEIESLIYECQLALDGLVDEIDDLCRSSSINNPQCLKEIESAISAAKVIAASKPIDKEVLLNKKWDEEPNITTDLIDKIKRFQNQIPSINSKFKNGVEEDPESLITEYQNLLSNYFIIQFFDSNYANHPWKVNNSNKFSSSDEIKIEELIDKCKTSLGKIEHKVNNLCENVSIHKPLYLEEIEPTISAAKVVAASKPVDKEVLLNQEWNEKSGKAQRLIKQVQDFQEQKSLLESKFITNTFEKDIQSIAKEYKELSAKFILLRIINSRYRYLKNEISSFYKDVAPKNTDSVISDLNELSECINIRDKIRDSNEIGMSLFGSHWNNEESDPEMLDSFSEWIVSFRKQLLKNAFNDQVVEQVSSGISRENVNQLIDELALATENFIQQRNKLADFLGVTSESLFNTGDSNTSFEDINIHLDSWKDGIVELQRWKKLADGLYLNTSPEKGEEKFADLNELSECIQSRKAIRELNETGISFFGHYWKDEESDTQELESFTKWIISFRKCSAEKMFDENVIETINAGVSKPDIEQKTENVTKRHNIFIDKSNQLCSRLNLDHQIAFDTDINNVLFDNTSSKLKLWKENITNLQKWGQFTVRREECLETFAAPIINLIDSDVMEANDIIPCFKGNFAEALIRYAFTERPTLASFMGELHEKKIESFKELDSELIVENRQRLAHLLYKKQPSILNGASPKSESGILLGEFNRKRKHMPIRKLMKNAGGLIQKIKPCFMMSPLSIAQFLDPLGIKFDVVVFDEASQVRPQDALGSLLRANQCVIIGDTRQLPPTSFFDKMIDSMEENDEDMTTPLSDIESILHLCKRNFPAKNLRWHYRSRHESLIAVSNQEFYDNRLVIYPSPIADLDHLGLKFVHLPDTVYDRGKSSVNRKEAQAVAQAALEHFTKYPEKSLGIGTFNLKQQQAILEEVEMLLMKHPEMTEFFESKRPDHFFVKNLETIQGDERDVIFISVGFGYDKNNNLNLNFGPLNREGGERRLNVLITRAREKCVVFSNFKSKDLATNNNSPFGVRALKTFLDFAENRNLHSIDSKEENLDSPIEKSVHDFLIDCGYDVEKKVGCGGYRVDLAIVDSRAPGRYLLGIECDGDKYHSSKVARDRDRLRQQILENLGWTIYRIWSTDWYRNKNNCQVNLKNFIEQIKSKDIEQPKNKNVSLKKSQQNVGTGVEREQFNESDLSNDDFFMNLVQDYQICSEIDIDTQTPIHELSYSELENGIIQVLKVESPVHVNEVIKRIRENHGLKRTGGKIKKAITKAVEHSARKGKLTKCGDFLWLDTNDVNVRRRGEEVAAKIDLICDEEISEAAKIILKNQHATHPDELAVQTSRLFGIQSTSKKISQRINDVINQMIEQEECMLLSNGMVDLAE